MRFSFNLSASENNSHEDSGRRSSITVAILLRRPETIHEAPELEEAYGSVPNLEILDSTQPEAPSESVTVVEEAPTSNHTEINISDAESDSGVIMMHPV